MFAHANFLHILFNMYALWLFGSMLERTWGPAKFLIFYLVCGLGAAVTQLLFVPGGAALGASGAVMGLMAAFAYTYPNMEFFIIPFPFAIKAKWLVVGYAAIDLFGGISGSGGIAHFAHLGGLVTGFILMIFWISKRRRGY
jgi:membrane associated rhomboid family serine protease